MSSVQPIVDLAAAAFASHVLLAAIRGQGFEIYHVGNSTRSRYSFSVHILSGHLWVSGDLGNLLIRLAYGALTDWRAWLADALLDPDYLARCVVPEMCVYKFDQDAAHAYANALAQSGVASSRDLRQLRQAIDSDQESFRRCLVEVMSLDPMKAPTCRTLDDQFHWHVLALGKLLELLRSGKGVAA